MNARSRVSEFDTPEQAAACVQWLRAKGAASLADDTTPVAHTEAMKRARAITDAKRARQVLELVWRNRAVDDLQEIIGYIAERDWSAAERLQQSIEACAERLPYHPTMYRPG